ncbi:MAG: tRNA (adenine-N1)-methyltransferase [Deltaproteobacteria bacterium]
MTTHNDDNDKPTRAAERPIESGETLLFIDEKGREYLRELRPGRRLSFQKGHLDVDPIIGRHDGLKLRTSGGGTVFVFRPTYDRLIPNLPRKAQVIYPKDSGAILTHTDIYPGARVIESGVGPGALTMALLRAIGPEGTLVSIERREDHIKMARENIAAFYGDAPNWTTILASAEDEIPKHRADRIILDLPDPAPVIPAAAEALRPGGMVASWVPTTLQLESLGEALRTEKRLVEPRTSEILERFWHVAANSIRPDHRMVAHTGFLTTAWRLADEEPLEPANPVEKTEVPV